MLLKLTGVVQQYNAIDLSGVKGLHVFYNQLFVRVQFTVLIMLLLGLLFALVFAVSHGFYAGFLIMVPQSLAAYFGWKSFGWKAFVKNPVFILSEGRLYYLKTNCWYDPRDYTFEDNYFFREEFAGYFTMFDQQKRVVFEEKSLDLKQEQLEKLKGHIRYILNLDKREQLVKKNSVK